MKGPAYSCRPALFLKLMKKLGIPFNLGSVQFSVALILACWLQAESSTLIPKSLNELLVEADGVVVGIVSSINSRYGADQRIYTFVTLTDLQIVYGQHDSPSLVLQLSGGEVNGIVLEISGGPKFRRQERVVLFLRGNGRELFPFVGWTQGVFRVFHDGKKNTDRIKDHDGSDVLGLVGDDFLKRPRELVRTGASGGRTDDGSLSEPVSTERQFSRESLTLRDFLNTIHRKVREKGLKGRTIRNANVEALNDAKAPQADAPPPQSPR